MGVSVDVCMDVVHDVAGCGYDTWAVSIGFCSLCVCSMYVCGTCAFCVAGCGYLCCIWGEVFEICAGVCSAWHVFGEGIMCAMFVWFV